MQEHTTENRAADTSHNARGNGHPPLVSVLLPSLRPQAVAARIREFEITNGNCDYEIVVVSPFKVESSRVVHVPEIEKRGVIAALLQALNHASGELIVYWSDDASPTPNCLQDMARFVQSKPSPFIGAFRLLDGSGKEVPQWQAYGRLYACWGCFSRATLKDLGGFFDPVFRNYWADPDLSMRAWWVGGKVQVCRDAFVTVQQICDDLRKSNFNRDFERDTKTFLDKWHDRFGGGKPRPQNWTEINYELQPEEALRRANEDPPPAKVPAPKKPVGSDSRPQVLYIPLEWPTWEKARSHAYTVTFAIEEGFRANGMDAFVMPAFSYVSSSAPQSWLSHARELCRGRTFDQVWLGLVHCAYSPDFLDWVSQMAPVRVGLLTESLEYLPEEWAQIPALRTRKEFVMSQVRALTHVVCVDECDVDSINASGQAKAFWWPSIVPRRTVFSQYQAPPNKEAVFFGSMYSAQRRAWVERPDLHSLLALPKSKEYQTAVPARFDELHQKVLAAMQNGGGSDPNLLSAYVDMLRVLRQSAFDVWMEGLREWQGVVNLPTFCKCYAGRVVEAMGAGRPAIAAEIVNRPRNKALFEDGKEILLYRRDDPSHLAEQIRLLQKDPELGRVIALNAREKVLQFHTAEVRIRQVLDWIQTGRQPEFGENRMLSQSNPAPTESEAGLKSECCVPNTESCARKASADSCLQKAEAAFQAGDLPSAREQLRQAANLLPNAAPVIAALGSLEYQLGDNAAALSWFVRAVRLQPTDANVHVQLAMAAWRANDATNFTFGLETALRLDPKSRAARRLLADSLFHAGKLGEAGRHYLELAQEQPGDLAVLLALGDCLAKGGEWNAALCAFEAALAAAPDCKEAQTRLQEAKQRLGESLPAPCEPNGAHVNAQQKPIKEPSCACPPKSSGAYHRLRIVAIVAAHNEGDVIFHVLGDLIRNGLEVYFIDHCSSDNTVAEAAKWLNRGLLKIEKFPEDSGYPERNASQYVWTDILRRKEELAAELGADWYIHADADEFRESPWPGLTLAAAIQRVDALGYNAVNFELLNFRPTDNRFVPGGDVREHLTRYEAGELFNALQIKAWKHTGQRVGLAGTGGHSVEFAGRKVFPVKFLLRHYPIRSEDHGRRKVFAERLPRFAAEERANGWHVQYNALIEGKSKFLYDPAELVPYDPNRVRAELLGQTTHDLLLMASLGGHPIAPEAFDEASLFAWAARRFGVSKPIPSADWQAAEQLLPQLANCFEDDRFNSLNLDTEVIRLLLTVLECRSALSRVTGTNFTAGSVTKLARALEAKLGQSDQTSVRLAAATAEIKSTSSTAQGTNTDPHSAPPKTTIVILTFNKLEFTRKCLTSLRANTPSGTYEVIVVDNNSTDGTREFLRFEEKAGRLTAVLNDENVGFGKGCNLGVHAATGEYLLFLNNDTEPQPGWLEALVETLISDPKAGAVGAKLVYPDGRLQEAGAIIFSDASGWNYGRGDSPHEPKYNFLREVDYCSAACLLVRKKVFQELGGFDDRYAPAYYEDADLCFALRQAGWHVLYQPTSVVIHHEGVTGGKTQETGFKRYQVINREKFREKWSVALPQQAAPGAASVEPASDRRAGSRILVVDAFIPKYDKAAGSRRMYEMLRLLSAGNHKVTFVAQNGCAGESYAVKLQRLGVEVYQVLDLERLLVRGFDPSSAHIKFEDLLKRQYDTAILSFWHVADRFLPRIRQSAPRTRVVVDTVDLHYVREGREAELAKSSKLAEKAHARKRLELDTYSRADELIVVTETDRNTLRRELPSATIKVLPTIHSISADVPSFDSRGGVLFVGNFAHAPNVDAVLWFHRTVWPKIRSKLPGAVWTIVGNCPPPAVQALCSDGVNVTGYVPETEPYLRSHRVSIAPVRYGAGIKGKIGDAMAAGLPVVTTSVGAEGMADGTELPFITCDDPQEFADAVVRLYQDPAAWARYSELGRAHVRAHYTPECVSRQLEDIVSRRCAGDLAAALPPCALVGDCAAARELYHGNKLPEAWTRALGCVQARPLHPEGFLLLAEIAQKAGDFNSARVCAEHARRQAPGWKPARRFLNRCQKGGKQPDWLEIPGAVQHTDKPRLSACILVKDDEKSLRRCLQSLQGLADQVVLVHAGSNDDGLEIGKEFEAEIHSLSNCTDPTSARNVALEHANGDWVLALDSNEEIPADSARQILEHVGRTKASSYTLAMAEAARQSQSTVRGVRLFRNAAGLYFTGQGPETVGPILEPLRERWGLEERASAAVVLRHEVELESSPRETERDSLHQAETLARENRHVEAFKVLQQMVGVEGPLNHKAWRLGAQIALSQPEFLEFAGDWTREALNCYPDDIQLIALRAEALMLGQDTEAARDLWQRVCTGSSKQPAPLAALILCEAAEGEVKHQPAAAEMAATVGAFLEWYRKCIGFEANSLVFQINSHLDALGRALPQAARMLTAAMAEAETATA